MTYSQSFRTVSASRRDVEREAVLAYVPIASPLLVASAWQSGNARGWLGNCLDAGDVLSKIADKLVVPGEWIPLSTCQHAEAISTLSHKVCNGHAIGSSRFNWRATHHHCRYARAFRPWVASSGASFSGGCDFKADPGHLYESAEEARIGIAKARHCVFQSIKQLHAAQVQQLDIIVER